MPTRQPHVERVLDFDGEPVIVRLQIEAGLGFAGGSLGVFPVTRLSIGRDDQGLFLNVACAPDKPGEPTQYRRLAS